MKKENLKKTTTWLLAAAVFIGSIPGIPAKAEEQTEEISGTSFGDTGGGFVLYDGQSTAPVFMDESYESSETDAHTERSYEQVERAVGDFRQDVAMVTGGVSAKEVQQTMNDSQALQSRRLDEADQEKVPAFYQGNYEAVSEDYAVFVGTIGDSPLIDGLVEEGKLDEAKDIAGEWEAYIIKEVSRPLPGVEKGLVIAGSDARGTIYGIYEISEKIGVSPFYWYSDVPVETKEEIVLTDYAQAEVNRGPDVKYRGIFINDEDISVLNWAANKFEDEEVPGLHYYRHVFELLLRLRCNFLWPAMHEVSDAFNTQTDEDGIPVDSKEAAKYGIVMGSSHCEILLRANTSEWSGWYAANKDKYGMVGSSASDAYDFSKNETGILQYWRERLETNKEFESILTLGIRGVHDGAFNCDNLSKYEGSTDAEKRVSFMTDVIQKQRKLIAEVYLDGDMSRIGEVPQVLIPYKEMGTVYNDGLNKVMAQEEYRDVTLMWAEDNFGYVRQVPNSDEADREGGTGIYYHSSYWGTPSCYLWLNSTPLAQLSEQLHRAYDAGIRNQWVLNVGDIKPGDQALEFYAKMAWDTQTYQNTTIKEAFQIPQAMRDYHMDSQTAAETADIMEEYYRIISVKKPEFYTTAGGAYPMSPMANGDEALKWLERCQKVTDRMTAVYEQLEPEYQTPFYEQMYYHVLSMNDAAREYVYYWKAQQAAAQGRTGSLRIYTELSRQAADTIRNRVEDYNSLNQGKWEGYMSWKHVASSGSEDYNHDIIQSTEYPSAGTPGTGAGAAAEGCEEAGAGALQFDSLSGDVRYFDVFSKQTGSVAWCAEVSEDWINLSKTQGETATEERVLVTVDWDQVTDTQTGSITVYNTDEQGEKQGEPVASFEVQAQNRAGFDYEEENGYVEANGYVMLEAEHYTENLAGEDESSWQRVENNGQRGDTMKAMPNTAAYTQEYDKTAKLVYRVYFKKAGTFSGTLYRLPTLNEGTDDDGRTRTCRIGIGVGDSTPEILKGNSKWQEMYSYNNPSNTWAQNIMRMYEPLNFTLTVEQGWNEITVYRMDAAIIFDRILIQTEEGAVKDSLLGPDESPNNLTEREAVLVAKIPDEITQAEIPSDMELTQGEGQTVYQSDKTIIEASSGEERVAQVEVADGRLFVTPNMAGTAEITAVTEEGSFYFTVKVTPDTEAEGSYREENGQVVILAADAYAQTKEAFTKPGSDGHDWALYGIGLRVIPDIGTNWTDAAMSVLSSKAPAVSYQVTISQEGTYRLYVNTSNPDYNSDSYHVAVDGTLRYTDKNDSGGGTAAEKETWYGGNQAITLTAGEHTITLFAREDGFVLNQLLLTTGEKPSGLYTKSSVRAPAQVPEDVVVRVEAEDVYTLSDGMKLDGAWSDAGAGNGKWLKTIASKERASVSIQVEIPRDGLYRVETRYRSDTSGRATVQILADGTSFGEAFSMAGDPGAYTVKDHGSVSLTKGIHILSYEVADEKGTNLGLDYLQLSRVGEIQKADQEPEKDADTPLLSEDFEKDGESFGFTGNAFVQDGVLHLTEGTKDNETAVKYFSAQVMGQSVVDLTFDWTSGLTESGGKSGITLRDTYGRLVFALCGAYSGGFELRYSEAGGRLDEETLAGWYEPVWKSISMTAGKTYTIHLKADFAQQRVSYDITEKESGTQLVKEENVETDAKNLATMTACSYYTAAGSYAAGQRIDNFLLWGEQELELPLEGKTLYAFGDSIVYGHKYQKASFPNFVARIEGMNFTNEQKFGVNGATILESEHQILSQIQAAPKEAPDYILLDGGINDAYETLDETEFSKAFEATLTAIMEKWPTAKLLYVAVHKTNTREAVYQERVYTLATDVCSRLGVKVADLYGHADYDCLNVAENVTKYAFDELGENGLPLSKGVSATHPNLDAIEAFYVPAVSKAFRELEQENTDTDIEEIVKQAEQAAKAAQEAQEAAKTAAEDAQAAKQAADTAAEDAQNAATAAAAAEDVAQAAKQAAVEAAQAAQEAQAAIADDREAAQQAAQRAEAAKQTAQKAEADAQTARTEAKASQEAAQAAQAAAQEAAKNAQEAQRKSETAGQAAIEAAEAAENASQDAEAAKKKAKEAKELAEAAAAEAQEAGTGARQANEAAGQAAAEASQAKEAAQTAENATKLQTELALAYASAAEASAQKAIAAGRIAEEAAKKAEEVQKQAEAALEKVRQAAAEKLQSMEQLLDAERFQGKKVKIKALKSKKNKAILTWKPVDTAEGYVVEYAGKASFKGKKTIRIKNGKTAKKTIKKLSKGKTVFVRIRAYKTVDGKKIYTQYAKKKVRVKGK